MLSLITQYIPFNLLCPFYQLQSECIPFGRVVEVSLNVDNDVIRVRVILIIEFWGRHTSKVSYVEIHLVGNLFNS